MAKKNESSAMVGADERRQNAPESLAGFPRSKVGILALTRIYFDCTPCHGRTKTRISVQLYREMRYHLLPPVKPQRLVRR